MNGFNQRDAPPRVCGNTESFCCEGLVMAVAACQARALTVRKIGAIEISLLASTSVSVCLAWYARVVVYPYPL